MSIRSSRWARIGGARVPGRDTTAMRRSLDTRMGTITMTGIQQDRIGETGKWIGIANALWGN